LRPALVFGLVPALRASRPDLVPALKDGSATSKRRRFELRDVLVVVQIAVSLVLVVGARSSYAASCGGTRAARLRWDRTATSRSRSR
jgi:hypothetical protein